MAAPHTPPDAAGLADRAARIICDLRAAAACLPGGADVLRDSLQWLDDYRSLGGRYVPGQVVGAEVRRLKEPAA